MAHDRVCYFDENTVRDGDFVVSLKKFVQSHSKTILNLIKKILTGHRKTIKSLFIPGKNILWWEKVQRENMVGRANDPEQLFDLALAEFD